MARSNPGERVPVTKKTPMKLGISCWVMLAGAVPGVVVACGAESEFVGTMELDAGAGMQGDAASGGEAEMGSGGTGGNEARAGKGGMPSAGSSARGGAGSGGGAGTGGTGGATGGNGAAAGRVGTGGAAGTGSGDCGPHLTCAGDCLPGFADCDGDLMNGCESLSDEDPANCGSCGNVCAAANSVGVCVAGACLLVCDAGFDDCNGDVTDGCEVGVGDDEQNCGGCGVVCADFPVVYACIDSECSGTQCANGETTFDTCAPNFNPDGDCICESGFWACPQVACPPCPEPVPHGGCLGSTELVYAHVPGGAQCCTYEGICNVPDELTPYATLRECAQAWRDE